MVSMSFQIRRAISVSFAVLISSIAFMLITVRYKNKTWFVYDCSINRALHKASHSLIGGGCEPSVKKFYFKISAGCVKTLRREY